MSSEQQLLENGIAALEAQRALLGHMVVDAAVAGLRGKLSALIAAASAEPEQVLRQVSILFLDVVGSTSISQHLDPEDISAVMDGALARGTAIVQAHRGKVLQYAGDNLLAAFGADGAAEDDAEQAVRCGLALLELGRSVGAEVEAAHGRAGFDVRVGIHTGGVLLGGGVDADGSIRGLSVNIAARMEQTAPVGALRISQATYGLVRGLFEVEVQAAMLVKGVDAPMTSYLVIRAKPRNFRIGSRGIEGVATRMVGRDAELEVLQQAFMRLHDEDLSRRRLAVVIVVADAGIGKSRLLYEFEAWSEARPEFFYLFRGRASPQTQGRPFGLLRDVLAWRLQIADDDSLDAAKAKIEQGIVPLFELSEGHDLAEAHAHVLGHLIGIEWRESPHIRGILDDPKQLRSRALHAAAELFRRVSGGDGGRRSAAIVLQLEDLHWADNESLDFLSYLAEVDRDLPMLLLAFARPTLFERRPDWRMGEGSSVRIDLAPLDKPASRALADEILKKLTDIPSALRELVIGGSEGNPFYMEELVRMLIDQGALQTGERWSLNADKLLATKVPATLTGVLQARLDGLPAPERLTLQEASVIGHVFWDQALIALDAQAADGLPRLVRRELALPRVDGAFDGLREYAFKHQILHQVTYGTVLKRTRRELHGRLAHWLAAQTGSHAGHFLGVAADHFEQAGDTARAAEFHARAAEYAASRFAHDGTLAHVRRALDLLGAPSGSDLPLRWRLLDVFERTLELQGQRAEQLIRLEALDALADALDDDRRRAEVGYRRAFRALRMGDWVETDASARRARTWAERAGAAELRLLSQRLVATAMAMQGDRMGGKLLSQQTLDEARSLGLPKAQAPCLVTLAAIANLDGDILTTLDLNARILDIYRGLGDRRGQAQTLANLGGARLGLGDLGAAERDLDESLRLLRANGDRVIEGATLCARSTLARYREDAADAKRLARSALDISVAAQAREWQVVAGLRLGEAELALGDLDTAALVFEQSRVLANEIGSAFQHEACAQVAGVALARHDMAAALQAIGPLLAHVADVGADAFSDRSIELTCYQVLAANGDDRATEWLLLAHGKLMEGADRIADAGLRRSYLDNLPDHRDIRVAWLARRTSISRAADFLGADETS